MCKGWLFLLYWLPTVSSQNNWRNWLSIHVFFFHASQRQPGVITALCCGVTKKEKRRFKVRKHLCLCNLCQLSLNNVGFAALIDFGAVEISCFSRLSWNKKALIMRNQLLPVAIEVERNHFSAVMLCVTETTQKSLSSVRHNLPSAVKRRQTSWSGPNPNSFVVNVRCKTVYKLPSSPHTCIVTCTGLDLCCLDWESLAAPHLIICDFVPLFFFSFPSFFHQFRSLFHFLFSVGGDGGGGNWTKTLWIPFL